VIEITCSGLVPQVTRAVVGVQRLPITHRLVPGLALGCLRAVLQERERLLVRRDEAGLGAAFDRHVADGHAAFHRQRADRLAGIFQRIAGATGGADLADDGEDDVLGGDALRQLTVDHRAHVLRFRLDQRLGRQHVLHFRGADAVGERAERAMGRGVAVAAHDRGARQREALLGADDVDDALPLVELVEVLKIEVLGVLGEIGDLRRALGIRIGLAAVGGRHVVIDHQQRLLRRAHLAARKAQSLERLRRRHLMHEVPVDIDQAGSIRLLVDQVVVPDFVVEGTRLGHSSIQLSGYAALFSALEAFRKVPNPAPAHVPIEWLAVPPGNSAERARCRWETR
jgi:hypothetical protein